MTEDERQIADALLHALVQLSRTRGTRGSSDLPLTPDEMAELLARLGKKQAMRAPDAQDLPYALPDPLD